MTDPSKTEWNLLELGSTPNYLTESIGGEVGATNTYNLGYLILIRYQQVAKPSPKGLPASQQV
jgi:hypothetical protein